MPHWRKINDFDGRSFGAGDFFTKQLKHPPTSFSQPHEADEFVIRGPEILFSDGRGLRSLGYADFRPSVLRQLAIDVLDMVPRGQLQAEISHAEEAFAKHAEARSELNQARDLLAKVITERNELAEQATEAEADYQALLGRFEALQEQTAAVPATGRRPKTAARA